MDIYDTDINEDFKSVLADLLEDFAGNEDDSHCSTSSFPDSEKPISLDEDETKYKIPSRLKRNEGEALVPTVSPNNRNNSRLLGKKGKKPRKISLTCSLVKTDLRESYPKMFINALNTSNFQVIQDFFSQFCTPEVTCHMRRFIPHQNTTFLKKFDGTLAVANLLYTNIALAPDSLLNLESFTFFGDAINQPVSFTFKFYMTKVYNVPSIHEALPNMVVDRTADGKSLDVKEVTESTIMNTIDSLKKSLSLRKTPVQCSYEVRVIMLTNPLNKTCTQIGLNVEQQTGCFSTESHA